MEKTNFPKIGIRTPECAVCKRPTWDSRYYGRKLLKVCQSHTLAELQAARAPARKPGDGPVTITRPADHAAPPEKTFCCETGPKNDGARVYIVTGG